MINVTKSHLPDINKYKKYIDKIFESGWLTNNGQFVQELQRRLEEYLGVKNLVLVSNGTLALQIAYKALELKGEVLTTPFSFAATSSSLVWEGLRPKYVDIDRETFNMDYSKISCLIEDETCAIVPVHVFGNACEIDKIENIAKQHKLKVIYDAAHAFGVNYKGKSILSYGDISTISFHSTKLFHTIEGGAIVVNNDELYEKVKVMVSFGIRDGERVEILGTNSKMNEFQAAMGLCVLDNMQDILDGRKRVYDYYANNLPKELQLQKQNIHSTPNYAYFPVVFDSEETLLRAKENLNQNQINPRRYFYPSLNTLPYISKKFVVPVSSSISSRILCLPIYDTLGEKELDNIIRILKEVI
ncbi:DegT/DnrJ/EryC1/StrS family aminotransferase [Clostridium sp. OS1-26]|uniref:DegT/DnrJ/EryC1/StrS family aminotransferase n=1 Tax=Clostridium sp. OS1-26 TaxID=3070681 RepID=UPI0027E1B3A1|nr:DegT/DnrJ/EryC1/StrS family aminotransferase [Clostridium sp. OS1-26]WML35819.1 DegT/DnrJ/EryC1/StrS family aminotransferase [Clostridium sp. OS1-26]